MRGQKVKSKFRQRHKVNSLLRIIREWIQFAKRQYAAPSPTFFKMKTLISFSLKEGHWVETGTYMGGTTKYLAKRFPRVISIEPSPKYFLYSESRLKNLKNITLLHGTSEELFEGAILSAGPVVNLWLDGHFSEGGTFLGSKISPVEEELNAVIKHIEQFQKLVIFIDDIRLFARSNDQETGYPKFQWLVDWCTKNGFKWQIQNDILIAEMVRPSHNAN
jgi:hypothetical protein